ncbi:hypothetical protein SEB_01065 [Staphylococcus epidermidis PM221]|nr:hypothetical protein SEB_01065 [Staphylococcus epidermidis PM221]
MTQELKSKLLSFFKFILRHCFIYLCNFYTL